jgi:hypothetical protein
MTSGQIYPVRGDEIPLPGGRFLYRPVEPAAYVIVSHPARGLWVTEKGWTARSSAAGPFRADQVLRALRLANTRIPQGCELGPWQTGLELFATSTLPSHANDWQRVEEDWLTPSVSRYAGSSIDQVVNETCCARPTDRPCVAFDSDQPHSASDVREHMEVAWPELNPVFAGVLLRPWNAHPEGSAVWAHDHDLEGDFAVIDFPAARLDARH